MQFKLSVLLKLNELGRVNLRRIKANLKCSILLNINVLSVDLLLQSEHAFLLLQRLVKVCKHALVVLLLLLWSQRSSVSWVAHWWHVQQVRLVLRVGVSAVELLINHGRRVHGLIRGHRRYQFITRRRKLLTLIQRRVGLVYLLFAVGREAGGLVLLLDLLLCVLI